MAPDFSIKQTGSFTRLEALSSRARSAPDRLFSGLDRLPAPTGERAWVAFPGALTGAISRLQSAGYFLAFA